MLIVFLSFVNLVSVASVVSAMCRDCNVRCVLSVVCVFDSLFVVLFVSVKSVV